MMHADPIRVFWMPARLWFLPTLTVVRLELPTRVSGRTTSRTWSMTFSSSQLAGNSVLPGLPTPCR